VKTVLFICSPNLGMFDVWLPVIDSLKTKTDVSVSLLLPKPGLIDLVDNDSILTEMMGSLVDRIVFRTKSGLFVSAGSFSEARRINQGLRKGFTSFLERLTSIPGQTSVADVTKGADAVLFDVTETEKPYLRTWLRELKDVPKFSLFHGAEIERHLQPKRAVGLSTAGTTTAYLYSHGDRAYFRDVLRLPESRIKVIGIPRLNQKWAGRVIDRSKEKAGIPWTGYVVLISRPVVEPYLSLARKKKAVENIRRLIIDELGLNLVIKLHPKESGRELYDEVFGRETYGKRWIHSNLHPFVLSRDAVLGISFYSGVVTDFLIINKVPCIETVDLRGIPDYDNEKSLRDKDGEPIFTTRYNGIVLKGSDYESLRRNALYCLNDRGAAVKELTDNFKAQYALIEDPASVVVDDILQAFKKSPANKQ
jgi:hypothetical protein